MTIKAAVVLHNYLKSTDFKEAVSRRYAPPRFVDCEDDNNKFIPGEWRQQVENIGFGALGQMSSNNHCKSAAQIRDDFKNYFLTDAGSLPWQSKVADRGRVKNN